MKKNPWLGNLVGIAKGSKAEGSDSSAWYSSEEEKDQKEQKSLLPKKRQGEDQEKIRNRLLSSFQKPPQPTGLQTGHEKDLNVTQAENQDS